MAACIKRAVPLFTRQIIPSLIRDQSKTSRTLLPSCQALKTHFGPLARNYSCHRFVVHYILEIIPSLRCSQRTNPKCGQRRNAKLEIRKKHPKLTYFELYNVLYYKIRTLLQTNADKNSCENDQTGLCHKVILQ